MEPPTEAQATGHGKKSMYMGDNADSMDQEVNKATVALKGMLGLGKDEEEKAEDPTPTAPSNSKTKKKKKKKGKPGDQNNPVSGDGTKESSTKGKKKNNKKGKQKPQKGASDNFAWSAFQSSPDASTLPIPTFSPAKKEKEVVSDKAPALQEAPDLQSRPPQPEAATLENSNSAAAPKPVQSKNEEVLASTAPQHTKTMDMNHATQQAPMPPFAPQQQYPHPPPTQYQQQYFPPPPPPGYVTIQLRVPENLDASRQMIVPSPGGYPVQITVPTNIPPGMVIPVHVPTGPPLHVIPPGGFRPPPYPQQQFQGNNGRFYGGQGH